MSDSDARMDHLENGLYVLFDGYRLVIGAKRENSECSVVLEPETFEELQKFMAELPGWPGEAVKRLPGSRRR